MSPGNLLERIWNRWRIVGSTLLVVLGVWVAKKKGEGERIACDGLKQKKNGARGLYIVYAYVYM